MSHHKSVEFDVDVLEASESTQNIVAVVAYTTVDRVFAVISRAQGRENTNPNLDLEILGWNYRTYQLVYKRSQNTGSQISEFILFAVKPLCLLVAKFVSCIQRQLFGHFRKMLHRLLRRVPPPGVKPER